jgi:hypothetical protein
VVKAGPIDGSPKATSTASLCVSFLGFNPLGDGYDGRGLIDCGADHTFASLDSLGALRMIRRQLLTEHGVLDLRMTGYSYGGWTALQILHALSPWADRLTVRVGLVDPVCTFRRLTPLAVRWWMPWDATSASQHWLGLPLPGRGPCYARKPSFVTFAKNVFQRRGLIVRWNGNGVRMPFRARWFASQPIEGFENRDVSDEVSDAGGHIEVADRYARAVALETFGRA